MVLVTDVKETAGFATDEERWEAVAGRNAAADGAFYYSVRTTGVYCRPSCAARLARRENVAFHTTCEAAERAGFRPCKRCRPNEAGLAQQHAAAIAKACRLIESSLSEASEALPGLDELAKTAGMSRFHFHRIFRAITGVTPKAYASGRRAERVRSELSASRTVTEAIYGAGYNSSGRFYAESSEILGMTPSDFRGGGTRAEIRFAVGECSLGSILVAATEKGVCAITMGDDAEALVRELQDRFPRAAIQGGDREFESIVGKVLRFVEAPGLGLDLPLDVRGTAFQQRVWQALRAIPAGSTASYSEIAERIGAPKSVRAVAQACAANSIAIAIPCHRVVRNDGGLSGYRWGVERKRTLLEREAAR
jgi:AraC family transcriptional regulator of adaptative response/methylated-DNA-[protein]-cysteine methyltransferase